VRRLAFLFALAACGDDPAPTTPLASDGTHLRDAEGRIALLRGINARVEGVFDVTFSDGRTPLESIPPLTAADCMRMHELGLDLLRLPINWSAIEPQRDQFDDAYLDRVDAAVRCAADAGMFVLIDLHQDAYSKEIGEDGAPLWAISPAPTMLLEGPLEDLADRRVSAQVIAAFATFFDPADPAGLQAEFGDMLEYVATRWKSDPAVIGFEIFNEPVGRESDVVAMQVAAAARVRAAAPSKLVVFEPSATRNLFDYTTPSQTPYPTSGAVYGPHIYTFVFQTDQSELEQLEAAELAPSVEAARAEAAAWQTPLLIGEFGIGPTTPNADLWMGVQAELHDRLLASNAFWVWKEDSQGAWGVFDRSGDTWVERPQVVGWISRIHASRISGKVELNQYDRTTRALTLVTTGATAPHVIYTPGPTTVTCNRSPVELATGFAEVTCDGALTVTPR